MSLCWIQVDLRFIHDQAPDLAAALGRSTNDAIALMVRLWGWAVNLGPDDAPPTGLVEGAHAAARIERHACWDGPHGALVQALLEERLIERTAEGFRIKGMKRYSKTRKKSPEARSEQNRRAAEARWAKERARAQEHADAVHVHSECNAKTETETEIKVTTPLTPLPGGLAANALLSPGPAETQPSKHRRRPSVAKATDPRHHPLLEAIAATGYTPLMPRDGKAISRLLALADSELDTAGAAAPTEVLRRWRICQEWQGFPTARHLSDFADAWNTYRQPQRKQHWDRGEERAQRERLVGRGEAPTRELDIPPAHPKGQVFWTACLRAVGAAGMPEAERRLSQLQPIGMEDRRVVLWATDPFEKAWVEDNYGALISEHLPGGWRIEAPAQEAVA